MQVTDLPLSIPATRLGLTANPGADLFVFPQIGGFVGGDTVAGILAARMDQADKPTLLVDIGTNGEIVLALLAVEERTRAADFTKKVEHIDLSLDPEFQMEFGMAMMFPTTDLDGCMGEERGESTRGEERT